MCSTTFLVHLYTKIRGLFVTHRFTFSGIDHQHFLLFPGTHFLFPFMGSSDVLKFISGTGRVTRRWFCWPLATCQRYSRVMEQGGRECEMGFAVYRNVKLWITLMWIYTALWNGDLMEHDAHQTKWFWNACVYTLFIILLCSRPRFAEETLSFCRCHLPGFCHSYCTFNSIWVY